MIDHKVNQLRAYLSVNGVPNQKIETLIDSINNSVQQRIASVLENGIYSASQRAEELKAKGFISEITVKPSAMGIEIATDSGNQDYSRQPFPMLDSLLARGKVAKDGSLYRTIPIGSASKPMNTTVKDINSGVSAVREIKDKPRSLTEMVTNMAQSFGVGARPIVKTTEARPQGDITFRTASSKQDRNTRWVKPGYDADMAPILSEINASMAADIQEAIDAAIREHQMEIDDAIRDA